MSNKQDTDKGQQLVPPILDNLLRIQRYMPLGDELYGWSGLDEVEAVLNDLDNGAEGDEADGDIFKLDHLKSALKAIRIAIARLKNLIESIKGVDVPQIRPSQGIVQISFFGPNAEGCKAIHEKVARAAHAVLLEEMKTRWEGAGGSYDESVAGEISFKDKDGNPVCSMKTIDAFITGLNSKPITHGGCGRPNCPVCSSGQSQHLGRRRTRSRGGNENAGSTRAPETAEIDG